ncbi:MAG TPA: hypothetical protein DCQ64_00460 [Candidatus Rokubacteria bacterium]|nr:hypothetical protein [Candidatus Rokubacteria bacterium]
MLAMTDRADELARELTKQLCYAETPLTPTGTYDLLATALRAYAEEARREERIIAAKDSQMRYADGYDCGVVDEREACAKLVEDHGHSNGRIRASHKHLAAAIRARREKR